MGYGVWGIWLEADQAVCFSDGSGVGRQAAKRLLAKHHRRGHPAAGNTQVLGQCVGVDTIEIHCPLVGQRDGQRRYISTFNDINSRFALAVTNANNAHKPQLR